MFQCTFYDILCNCCTFLGAGVSTAFTWTTGLGEITSLVTPFLGSS